MNVPSVYIKCNWLSAMSGKSVKDTVAQISFTTEDDGKSEEDFNDLLNVKNAVSFLKPPDNAEPPTIHVKVEEEDVYLDKLVMFCDARTVEVFGNHEMYQSTLQGNVIEKSDEFTVLEYTIELKQTKEVLLKLMRRCNNEFFWIYSIIVKVRKYEKAKSASASGINFENVDNLIKDCRLSDAAKDCYDFMKSTQANGSPFSRLSDMFKPPFKAESISGMSTNNMNDLKMYIDYKFQILTEFMIIREKHMNDKLDTILEIIKAKK